MSTSSRCSESLAQHPSQKKTQRRGSTGVTATRTPASRATIVLGRSSIRIRDASSFILPVRVSLELEVLKSLSFRDVLQQEFRNDLLGL